MDEAEILISRAPASGQFQTWPEVIRGHFGIHHRTFPYATRRSPDMNARTGGTGSIGIRIPQMLRESVPCRCPNTKSCGWGDAVRKSQPLQPNCTGQKVKKHLVLASGGRNGGSTNIPGQPAFSEADCTTGCSHVEPYRAPPIRQGPR